MYLYSTAMITEKLARLVVDMDYDKLPEDVIYKAKQCFTDFLAVSLKGSRTPSSKIVEKLFKGGGESTVLGSDKANCKDASLVNGVFAHCLDLDDGHRFAQLHPGCSVIPAALSLSEALNTTGKEFITSIVAGYQISIVMGMISNPEHRNKGFHTTGTCGTFGAAAASCKAMRLGFEETVNAFGLAGTQAAGLLESDHAGSMGKQLHAGKSAQSGVISALLAKNGFTGANSIIEGNEGFLKAMVDSKAPVKRKYDIDMEGFLEKYHILDVYFKKYPVCRHLHSSIDATLELYNQIVSEGVKIEDIRSINIKTYKIASEHNDYYPQTVEGIRQSLPVAVTICILYGDLNLDNLKLNSEVTSIVSKVVLEEDENMDRLYPELRPSKVTITTDNNSYTSRVDLPMGEPEHPFDEKNITNKFHDLNPMIDLDVLNNINVLESFEMRDLMDTLNREFKVVLE